MKKASELDLLHKQLKAQFPNRQITILYDKLLDITTIRIDPPGLSPATYYWAAKEDEFKGSLKEIKK